MFFKKRSIIALGCIPIIALAQREAGSPESRTAYTVTYTETSQMGTRRSIGKSMYLAQRQDGSTATGSTEPLSSQIRSILLAPQKLVVLVSDQTAHKSTQLAVREGAVIPPRNPSPRCAPQNLAASMRAEYLGEDVVAGFRTFRYRLSSSQPNQNGDEQTFWFAPDVECYSLRVVSERKAEAARTGSRFVKEATSVQLGDPDPTLFAVPGNYAEVPPSELMRSSLAERSRTTAARGESPAPPEPPGLKEYCDRADKRYREMRPAQ